MLRPQLQLTAIVMKVRWLFSKQRAARLRAAKRRQLCSLKHLASKGVIARLDEKGNIALRPKSNVTPEVVAYVREHKKEIAELLSRQIPPIKTGFNPEPIKQIIRQAIDKGITDSLDIMELLYQCGYNIPLLLVEEIKEGIDKNSKVC